MNDKIKIKNYQNQYNTKTIIMSGVIMNKCLKRKRRIQFLNNIYEFNPAFVYTIEKQDGGFIAENKFFNIFGYGNTADEAEQELFEYINDLWDCYVNEKDENLDESAKVIKNKLLENVRKVQ